MVFTIVQQQKKKKLRFKDDLYFLQVITTDNAGHFAGLDSIPLL